MNKVLVSAAVIAILLPMPFVPQLSTCLSTYSAKAGRVVDASTGEGIADAFVITASRFEASNLLHGSHHEVPYRMLTKTDAHGEYHFPSTWGRVKFGLPGTSPQTSWVITVFKPPYTMEGDDAWWSTTESMRGFRPKSVVSPPSTHWAGLAQNVDPIRMQPSQLSFATAAYYYTEITWIGYDLSQRFSPDEIALRSMGNEFFRPIVCGLPPDQRVDGGRSMAQFVYDKLTFTETLRNNDGEFSMTDSAPNHGNPSARALCDVMSKGWPTL